MTTRQNTTMGAAEWGMLLALAGLWGSSFFFFKVLIETLPPLTVVLGRVGLAAVLMNVFLLARNQRMTGAMPWGRFVVMGLLNNVIPFSLIVWGEARIPSGVASMLNAATPVFGVLAAHVLTQSEPLTWARLAGVLFGLLGVIVLIGPDALAGLNSDSLPGDLACLAAAFSYALAGIYGRRFRGLPPLQIATGQLTGATLVMLPLAALVDRFWLLPMRGVRTWEALAAIAVLCTVLAYILYFRILATSGATNLLLVTFLLPASALLLGALFLGEHVPPRAYGGMALIGAALAAIDGRMWRAIRRPVIARRA